jgi:2,3-bisphosphoglycerate-dependent phosphoglycerate mutase
MKRRSAEVYLVRHGETEWNRHSRLQGQTDIALNETGIAQSMLLGEELSKVPFRKAFSSDLSRAFETARLLLRPHRLSIETSRALRERNAGQLEGQQIEYVNEVMRSFFLSPEALNKESYMNSSWHPELETPQSVFDRVSQFLLDQVSEVVGDSIVDDSIVEDPILVVSHGFVIRSFLDYFSFIPGRRWVIKNCGFIKIRVEGDSFHLLECNGVTEQTIM